MYSAVIILSIVGGAFSQHQITTCSNLPAIPILPVQFSGTWQVIERIENPDEQGECSSQLFTLNQNFVGTLTATEVVSGVQRVRNATVSQANLTNSFIVNFGSQNIDYYVVVADYANHALMYSCTQITATTAHVSAWKLGRNTTFSQLSATVINSAAASLPHLQNATWKSVAFGTACNGCNTLYSGTTFLVMVLAFIGKHLV